MQCSLDELYAAFNRPESAPDPIERVRRFTRSDDREVVGFVSAGLAFGRVSSILQSIDRVLAIIGPSPADWVRACDPARDAAAFDGIVHRWVQGKDVLALLWVIRQMFDSHGSMQAFFLAGDPGGDDVGAALDSFSARALALDLTAVYGRPPARPGVATFFPQPSAGSACKRLNLFLRWMVRRDALDLGVWTAVSPSRLIVPLDTHVVRVARCLRLTRVTSPGWRMAQQITAALRQMDPVDPVRYDFAMCHLGMMRACGFSEPQRDAQCPLRGVCRPTAHRRRPSRRPSGPR